MQQFIGKLALFLLVQVLLLAALCYRENNSRGYLAAIVDKDHRLINAPSPRVIFVGGSSSAFSLDCSGVERALGRSPINLGLALPFGLEFMLNEVRPSKLRSGDLVVLNLEYEHFVGDAVGLVDVFGALWQHPVTLGCLNFATTKKLADEGFTLFTTYLRELRASTRGTASPSIYRRASFDQYGDFDAQWHLASVIESSPRLTESWDIAPSRLKTVIELLNAYRARCRTRGVDVVFIYPAYPDRLFLSHEASIGWIDRELRNQLQIPILNTPESSLARLDCFFDNPYHMIRKGVDWRTESVILLLQKHLASPPEPVSKPGSTSLVSESGSSLRSVALPQASAHMNN
jgi:hypothetical protein